MLRSLVLLGIVSDYLCFADGLRKFTPVPLPLSILSPLSLSNNYGAFADCAIPNNMVVLRSVMLSLAKSAPTK